MERDGVLIIAVVLAVAIIFGNIGDRKMLSPSSFGEYTTGSVISPQGEYVIYPGNVQCFGRSQGQCSGSCTRSIRRNAFGTITELNRDQCTWDSDLNSCICAKKLLTELNNVRKSGGSSSSQQQSSTPRDTPVVELPKPKPTKPACECIYAQANSCPDDPQGSRRYCKKGGCIPSGNRPNAKTGMCVKREGIRPVRET